MTREQVAELLEACKAVYPNTYKYMDEREQAFTINEWTKALGKFDYGTCVKAWEKYRDTYKVRELNVAIYVGVLKDIDDAEKRAARQIEYGNPEKDDEWYAEREKCMRVCQKLWGWSEHQFMRIMGQKGETHE